MPLQLQIVSAERSLVNERVDEVEIPGAEGYFGVLPGHTPLLALLGAGELWYRKGQDITYLVVAYGFAEVLPDRVTVLAQIAEPAEAAAAELREVLLDPKYFDASGAPDWAGWHFGLLNPLPTLREASVPGVGSATFSDTSLKYTRFEDRYSVELSTRVDIVQGSLMLSLESTSSRMNRLARHEMRFGSFMTMDEMLRAIDAVRMEDVDALIHRVLDEAQLSLMTLGAVNRRHFPRGLLRS